MPLQPYLSDRATPTPYAKFVRDICPEISDGPVFYLRLEFYGHFITDPSYLAINDVDAVKQLHPDGTRRLIIDLSGEGVFFHPNFAARVVRLCRELNVETSNAAFVQTNIQFRESLLRSNDIDPEVKRLKFPFYDMFAFRLLEDALQKRHFETGHRLIDARRNGAPKALCLNASPRAHRTMLAYHILKSDYRDRFHITFRIDGQRKVQFDHLRAAVSEFAEKYRCSTNDVMEAVRNGSFDETSYPDSSAYELSIALEPNLYEDTLLSAVTETEMSNGKIVRYTEKSLKPFLLGHSSIVFGNPQTLKGLSELGFDVFSDLINSSYDRVADPPERYSLAYRSLEEQMREDSSSIWVQTEIKDRLHRNVSLFEGQLLAELKSKASETLLSFFRGAD